MSHQQTAKISWIYFITVAWGIITFWIPNHLPLTDLPQHAGQITLLKDMLLSQSKWDELFQINFLTPYLTSYLLATLLSFIFSVSTAFKILLSIGYVAFIYTSIQLRKHFKIDSRLDWLFILPFFGFAYQYGFLSFVLSVPIGLWFILLADRYSQSQSKINGIKLTAVGLLLLESHGLMFLFAVGLGGLILLSRAKNLKSLVLGILPYLVILSAFATIFIVNIHINSKLGLTDYTLEANQNNSNLIAYLIKTLRELPLRISQAFFYVVAGSKISIYPLIHVPALLIMFIFPWLIGLRVNFNNKTALLFITALVLLFIFTPVYIFGTYFVYQRFSILIIISYALLFSSTNRNDISTQSNISFKLISPQKIVLPLLIFCCWTVLAFNTMCAWKFSKESADIDNIISSLEPGQKALAIIYDPISKANNNSLAYAAYPQWYQAEKHGLVYDNFAKFAPMPVRFRQGKMYAIYDGADMTTFSWKKHRGYNYRYFFVRNSENNQSDKPNKDLFKGAPCEPKILASKGRWTVYEQLPCQ